MEIHGPRGPQPEPEPLRRLYLAPILIGLTLIGLGFLMLAYPLLAAIFVTIPLWIVGGALVAGGLSLRRSLRDWRAEVRRMSRRWWSQD